VRLTSIITSTLIAGVVVFEPMQDANLFPQHSRKP
jgi:hypothetical protein